MSLKLNQNLDTAKLSADFKSSKRIRIENILEPSSAEGIFNCLKDFTAWELRYSGPDSEPIRVSHAELIEMSADKLKEIATAVYKRGANGYHYIHKYFPMVDLIMAGNVTDKSMLFDIATFLNSAEVIKLFRDVTTNNQLVKSDPSANLYEPSHFKNLHDDMRQDENIQDRSIKRYGFVFGFTKNWSVNWGGEMSYFAGPNPSTAETSYPVFNSLEIFAIPTLHRVSMIMPFAAKGRYTVTGWMREDPDIIRLDLGDQIVEAE
ncbi:hypothetical protein N9060_00745 [Arenicella sp.]|nr:hypothetical protein [Arenicella sp.]